MELTIQNYIVQPVMLPILPTTGPYLPDPTNIDASYNVASGQLNIVMTFNIPGNLNPNQVTIKQYYPATNEPSKLIFYACYNSDSTSTPKPVVCSFKACALDASGNPITLGSILTITTMLSNAYGPKTSRGITSTVRTTEQ